MTTVGKPGSAKLRFVHVSGTLSYPALTKSRFNKMKNKDEFTAMLIIPPDSPDLAALKALIRDVGTEAWGADQAKWPRTRGEDGEILAPRMPLHKCEDKADINSGALPAGMMPGGHYITVTSSRAPGVVGPGKEVTRRDGVKFKGHLIDKGDSVHIVLPEGGTEVIGKDEIVGIADVLVRILDETKIYGGCKVKISMNAYTYGGPGKTFRAGISLGLRNVQKIADGTPLGGLAVAPEEEFAPATQAETGAPAGAVAGTSASDLI